MVTMPASEAPPTEKPSRRSRRLSLSARTNQIAAIFRISAGSPTITNARPTSVNISCISIVQVSPLQCWVRVGCSTGSVATLGLEGDDAWVSQPCRGMDTGGHAHPLMWSSVEISGSEPSAGFDHAHEMSKCQFELPTAIAKEPGNMVQERLAFVREIPGKLQAIKARSELPVQLV